MCHMGEISHKKKKKKTEAIFLHGTFSCIKVIMQLLGHFQSLSLPLYLIQLCCSINFRYIYFIYLKLGRGVSPTIFTLHVS